jgi:signal transduction histidine kinase/CheY-like chemotaxis protein
MLAPAHPADLGIAERIELTRRLLPYTLAANFFGAVTVVLIALSSTQPRALIFAWAALWCCTFLPQLHFMVNFRSAPDFDYAGHPRRVAVYALLTGVMWTIACFWFAPNLSLTNQFALLGMQLAMGFIAVPLLAPYPWALTSWMAPTSFGAAFVLLVQRANEIFMIVGPVIVICTYFVAFGIRRLLDEILRLRREHAMAVEELGAEKQLVREKEAAVEEITHNQTMFFIAANHDIRQPLQAMAAFAFAIGQRLRPDDYEIGGYLQQLNDAFASLDNLIDQTLHFAKITAGVEKPVMQDVAMGPMMDRLLSEFRVIALSKKISLRVRKHHSVAVHADPNILERILRNLISNAIRYTEQGGVLVSFRARGGRCLIEVWDTGSGISGTDQSKIFEQFYQGKNAEKRAVGYQKGYGLGLAIVRRLTERLGSSIELASRPGRGTVFRFSLPLADNAAAATDVAKAAPRHAIDLSGKTIMVIDDDPEILVSLNAVLSGAGATVLQAHDTKSLNRVLDDTWDLDLLLSDLHLVNELGTQLIREAQKLFPGTPSIVITGDAGEDVIAALREEGHKVYLKPIDMPVLLAQIDELLKKKK